MVSDDIPQYVVPVRCSAATQEHRQLAQGKQCHKEWRSIFKPLPSKYLLTSFITGLVSRS